MRGWMGLTRFSLPFENAMHEWGWLIGVYGVCEYFRLVIIPMHFPYIFGPFFSAVRCFGIAALVYP